MIAVHWGWFAVAGIAGLGVGLTLGAIVVEEYTRRRRPVHRRHPSRGNLGRGADKSGDGSS